ncbi:MAG: hypothetical protein M0R50_03215 [Candidatus Cloacimonetes bacterium]|jgi:hypothetical protein|nr:hypothetical protein [Candidatus Cloacimonadota bacterium]
MNKNALNLNETLSRTCDGEIEIIVKDVHGRVLEHTRTHNIVKIGAKEILAHRLPYEKIWDPNAGSGDGAWISSGFDMSDYAPKYILLGASFDSDGAALDTTDSRYYTIDPITGLTIPITLGVGAEYEGGLINAVPISEPYRPLKKVESIYFQPTYQPAGTPLLQDDVRAMNNIVVFETTLTKDEYNGFGRTDSDYFTITEVALAGGKELTTVGACECDPKTIFLEGRNDGTAITANTSGSSTISIDPTDSAYVDVISVGDQIKITSVDGTGTSVLPQVNDHYLVTSKLTGGSDIGLDRTPVGADGETALTGQVGIFRDSLRIFSHRILKTPFKKSSDFMIIIRWSLVMN